MTKPSIEEYCPHGILKYKDTNFCATCKNFPQPQKPSIEEWKKELLELSFWQGKLTGKEVKDYFIPFIHSLLSKSRQEVIEEVLAYAPKYKSKVIPLFNEGFDEAVSMFKENIRRKVYE